MQPQLALSYITHEIWALARSCEAEWSFLARGRGQVGGSVTTKS